MVEPDESSRKGAEEAARLEYQQRHEEALARIDELATKHPGSAAVLQTAGRIHHSAATRFIKANLNEEARHHLRVSQDYLTEAKRLVPNCVDISSILANVLFHSLKTEEAEDEIRRAMGIVFPVDPAENNVLYSVNGSLRTGNRFTRVDNCMEALRTSYRRIGEWACRIHVPRAICDVFELEKREGTAEGVKKANDLATRYPDSPRAQCFRAYMRLKFACGLDAAINRRSFLKRIRSDITDAANRFKSSLVLAIFRAKICFLLGLYEDAFDECTRVFAIKKPDDPRLEDVPPGSVNGEECDDRVSSIRKEVERLLRRILWVAKGFWCSMSKEKQESFQLVKLSELHKYYEDFEDDHWGAKTISDALSFVKKNRSWKFWICPFCVGKKFLDTDSLFRHMCNKHSVEKVLLNPKPVLDPKRIDDTSEGDYSLKEISVIKDSDDQYVIQLKKTHHIFEHLFLLPSGGIEQKSFTEMREEKQKEGTEILDKMRQSLKNFPADELSSELIQDFWHNFFSISALDYHVVFSRLSKAFRWSKLLQCMSEDDASKSISNTDINTVFPYVVDAPGSNGTGEHDSKFSGGNKDLKSGDDQQTENNKPSCSDDTIKSNSNAGIDVIIPHVVDASGSNAAAEHGSNPSNGNEDHTSGEDQQTKNMKPTCSDDTLKMDEEHKESEVHVEDENSGAMLVDNPSGQPIKMIEYENKLIAIPENVATDIQCEIRVEDENSGAMTNSMPSDRPTNMIEVGNKIDATPERVGIDLQYDVHVEVANSGTMASDKPSGQGIKLLEAGNEVNASSENVGKDLPHDVHFEDENFGVMVNDKSSDYPIKIVEDENKLNATPENVGTDLQREVHVEDENSGGMVDDKPSDKPMKMVEGGNKLSATSDKVGTDLKYDSLKGTSISSSSGQYYITKDLRTDLQYDIPEGTSLRGSSDQNYIAENAASDFLGISGQSADDMASISRYRRSVDVLKKYHASEDLFFLNVIVQSFWNLRRFRDEFLRRPPACFHLMHDGPCIAGKFYEIFSAWEKNEHFRMAPLLIAGKTTLCEIVRDSMFEKMQVGTHSFSRIQVGSNFVSEIMAVILEGLHKSETYLHYASYGKVEGNPDSCSGFICRAHDLFGIKLKQLMSCSCGEWFGEEHTSIFHKLDASSLDATKTQSLAQLPVLMDMQSSCGSKCNKCSGIIKHIGCFLSNRPHFLAVDLKNWNPGDVRQATMSRAFFGIASPFDITLLYKGVTLPFKGVRFSTKYNLVLVDEEIVNHRVQICHLEERYVCFVRSEQDKWYIYDIDTVKVSDSWEELLERYSEINLRPEVLFFEVIK